jgi:hypothetical protein
VEVAVVLSTGQRFGLSPAFTYLPRPLVQALDPASGPMTGGNTVTVRGTGFTSGCTVAFDRTAAGQVQVLSDTVIRVVAPSHLVGPVDVTVTTPGGTSGTSDASRYSYTP